MKTVEAAFQELHFAEEERRYKIRRFTLICVVLGVSGGVLGVWTGFFDWILRVAQGVDGNLAGQCRLYVIKIIIICTALYASPHIVT